MILIIFIWKIISDKIRICETIEFKLEAIKIAKEESIHTAAKKTGKDRNLIRYLIKFKEDFKSNR